MLQQTRPHVNKEQNKSEMLDQKVETYHRVQNLLGSMLPVEWFPTITQIILEQLKQANIREDKTHSFSTGNESWSPFSLQKVEDHIQDPLKESAILREVAIMAAFLHKQGEDFGNRPFTHESIKSQ